MLISRMCVGMSVCLCDSLSELQGWGQSIFSASKFKKLEICFGFFFSLFEISVSGDKI